MQPGDGEEDDEDGDDMMENPGMSTEDEVRHIARLHTATQPNQIFNITNRQFCHGARDMEPHAGQIHRVSEQGKRWQTLRESHVAIDTTDFISNIWELTNAF